MHFLETRIPPLMVAVLTLCLAVATDYCWLDGKPTDNVLLLILCGLLLLPAVAIGWLSIRQFARSNTTLNPVSPGHAKTVVSTGVFARTRNPMYLALGLVVLATCACFVEWWSLVFVLIYGGYLTRFQIIPEERALEKKFGESYREYRNKVRRWC
ncbi:MAG: hypothetical protein CSA52_02630 [Gammaproteobacteria bacterium]|nr:MAG: hypothetical protein CSB48_04300 [Pseudomonadota bacterium]PIE38297.1 MAG: hypothetical protein CSA52_02630 [Gammaproteobacteria bacterium]